jgi:hypothetical protein
VVIWYTLWPFGIAFPFLVCCTNKNLAASLGKIKWLAKLLQTRKNLGKLWEKNFGKKILGKFWENFGKKFGEIFLGKIWEKNLGKNNRDDSKGHLDRKLWNVHGESSKCRQRRFSFRRVDLKGEKTT